MPSLSNIRAENAKVDHPYVPTMIIVGGTSGIGQAIAEEFAKLTHGNAHIIIVGRNRQAAESILSRFPKPTSPQALHEFVECDMTLIKRVHAMTNSLLSRLEKVNYLVLSCGTFMIRDRQETEEGIDKAMAVEYYARWKMIHDLESPLKKARDAGEASSVLTILGAGYGGKVYLDDLSLRKHYGFKTLLAAMPAYNDAMIDSFSERNSGVHFCHIYPGTVNTPIFGGFVDHWVLRWFSPLVYLTVWLFCRSPEVCAQFMLWVLFNNSRSASRRGPKGEEIGAKGYYGSAEIRERIWDHTVELMKEVMTTTEEQADRSEG